MTAAAQQPPARDEDARVSVIQDEDDLRGMLPDEIVAVVKRLEAERDAAMAALVHAMDVGGQAKQDLAAALAELAARDVALARMTEAIVSVLGDHDHGTEEEIPCHGILERALAGPAGEGR